MIKNIKDLDKLKKDGLAALYPKETKISVGMATCGAAAGANLVYDQIVSLIKKDNLDVSLFKTGCLGFCQAEPIVEVWTTDKERFTYKNMTPEKVTEVFSSFKADKIKDEYLLCKCQEEADDLNSCSKVPFFSKQKKIVLRNTGIINPDSLEEYVARGGYYSLAKAVNKLTPCEVIEEVKKSGLRGRGGAGFPTGLKWELCAKSKAKTKYVVCNADEGDPGAYMDRSVLEGDPCSVLEGMAIAGFAIGAAKGFVYVRSEYPLVIERLKIAISRLNESGLLGSKIFGSKFSFDIELREGSGAFVCGEETSLIHSIEGKPPEPRQRPPFPVESGLWGNPTVINNVETLANLAVIIDKGSDWFSAIGTEKSKGTKVFSVVGKIKNTGLVEVPMGISLREIIYDIGGGIPEGKKFKAIQTGGPSGGCIPQELIDLPVDYESLNQAGSIMGSGGMVVMDEDTCVVDVAKFFLNFTSDESCGKCSSCRDGGQAMLEILTKISEGKAREDDLNLLEELAQAVKDASLCGLGQTLPNPVLSTLKYFKDEYLTHINDKKCPAGVCQELISYSIDPKKCKGCMLCAKDCPVQAISGKKGAIYKIDQAKCTKCGLCFDVCPQNFRAVRKG